MDLGKQVHLPNCRFARHPYRVMKSSMAIQLTMIFTLVHGIFALEHSRKHASGPTFMQETMHSFR